MLYNKVENLIIPYINMDSTENRIKKTIETLQSLFSQDYDSGEYLKKFEVEYDDCGRIKKLLFERDKEENKIKKNSDDLKGYVKKEQSNCYRECLGDKEPFVKGLIHDISDRLKEVYGETLPRELDQELDYIVSQAYQATLNHYSAINC